MYGTLGSIRDLFHYVALNLANILLEQDWAETRVESTDTLSLQDFAESRNETSREASFGDETNTGGLEWAKGDISDELGAGGRGEVDSGAVVGGVLVADHVNRLLLEEFVSTKLERTLEEVTSEGWASASKESASTLLGNDLAETSDQATVVGNRVELNTCLDTAMELCVSAKSQERKSKASFNVCYARRTASSPYLPHWRF